MHNNVRSIQIRMKDEIKRIKKILLKLKIAVSSDEEVESGFSGVRKQLAISYARPSLLLDGGDIGAPELQREPPGELLIEYDAYRLLIPHEQLPGLPSPVCE
jgi:hypothetical protein